MSASAGHRMKKTHVLDFFRDKNDDSALTVLANGVRFHAFVNYKKLKASPDGDNKATEEYTDLILAAKDRKQPKESHSTLDKSGTDKDADTVYCICRGPDRGFMIGCDSCDEWFHGDCVGVSKEEGASMDEYTCPECRKVTRSPTVASRDSGVVLEDNDKAESEPEEALQAWMVSHLEAEIDKHAPSRNEMQTTNVYDWYHPSTHFYSLQYDNGKFAPVEVESSPALRFKMDNLLPNVNLPKYVLKLDIPWLQASDLEVVEDFGPLPTLVRHNDNLYFLKVVDPSQPAPTKRELKIMKDIERLGLPKEIRVPQVHGLVSFTNSKTDMMGFLQTHIEGAEPLTHLLDSDVPQSKRDRWASESEKMIALLHENDIIWGDAKADNFMVDKDDKLWIIDFGGSYTEGWVDAELNETVEGDDMGTRKIVNALHDPDANTFDLDDSTEAEDKDVKRKRSRTVDDERDFADKRTRVE
ncbi:hypothetical protein AUEXF2481DRAFT_35209 [Aureobasidium subglaciale EXF-2481]|uniref:PHD-type domain-containing protein n=1 Tax=Aureobasidium subglaciale (strain EXF-2481) TaxID=1043005 RepID=A0A074YNB9_AURSE|nr:uncharacterized protein AUEXF2481DRAFT_35209 [Aureobasidium subglaciale EXF-2481]KAI5201954.1 hypothetical protein E4T38_05834 [Aureobasidium subglaciale]KAI5220842.1 hypothetical protein E4T40_05765 [Aureobasidium subglaciale]KAI5224732.1 hypothetical protein E4T41_05578 [Aureobasidium subglaciale]KAI5260858.1 hypothetical protein E4T46_05588 [Aureobasidium subglaciale]KEQ99303.1 hypothetical protein AUEXF2481DRAFT_35209 [Aureobasidium subglaciale EXF-2481]